MPVHLAGRPVDMDRLNALRDRHGITIVEDAAHALGAEWRGRPHRLATATSTAYSFYVTKNITTIEGGCLATDDAEIADRVERLALHGLSARRLAALSRTPASSTTRWSSPASSST